MPVSVDSLNLKPGESIMLNVSGSAELTVIVQVDKSGHCFVSGPINQHRTIFSLTPKGLKRARGMEEKVKTRTPS